MISTAKIRTLFISSKFWEEKTRRDGHYEVYQRHFFAIYFVFRAIFTIFAAEMKLKTKRDETIKSLAIHHHGCNADCGMQQWAE